MADECQDVSTQEELSSDFYWIVNGCPEEHFMTILHVKSADACTITKGITFIHQMLTTSTKQLAHTHKRRILTVENWCVKDIMGLQLSLDAVVEFNERYELMMLMHSISIVLATSYNSPLFQTTNHVMSVRRMFGTVVSL